MSKLSKDLKILELRTRGAARILWRELIEATMDGLIEWIPGELPGTFEWKQCVVTDYPSRALYINGVKVPLTSREAAALYRTVKERTTKRMIARTRAHVTKRLMERMSNASPTRTHTI